MMQQIPTIETPFNLAFETKAIIPLEIGLHSLRVEKFNEESNLNDLRIKLDLLEEM